MPPLAGAKLCIRFPVTKFCQLNSDVVEMRGNYGWYRSFKIINVYIFYTPIVIVFKDGVNP